MITRLRNVNLIKGIIVKVIFSRVSLKIAEILKKEGFIDSFDVKFKKEKGFLFIKLKYKGLKQQPYIANLIRISKPGSRVYTNAYNIPKVFGGIGIAVYSS
jgi:small subunit ribosomal protein S8